MSGAKDLANPCLGGFGFSRPKATYGFSRPTAPGVGIVRTVAPKQITLDCYHHPRKRFQPELRYVQAFDLYSYVQHPLLYLGVLTHQRHLKSAN